MKILVATKNKGKLREIKSYLQHPRLEIISLSDFKDCPDIEETGSTFEENAVLKAKAYFEWFPISHLRSKDRNREIEDSRFSSSDEIGEKIGASFGVIADDAGLEIDFLNGEPGVLSRRWPGHEAVDQELIDMALEKLEDVPKEKRTARLTAVGAYWDGKNLITERAGIDGYIVEEQTAECEPGYPFRAIFMVSKFGKLYQDLTHEEHEQVNHRQVLYGKLLDRIMKQIG